MSTAKQCWRGRPEYQENYNQPLIFPCSNIVLFINPQHACAEGYSSNLFVCVSLTDFGDRVVITLKTSVNAKQTILYSVKKTWNSANRFFQSVYLRTIIALQEGGASGSRAKH